MTHELKEIIATYQEAQLAGHVSALATVVALNGSSYRKPGVRMLVSSNGKLTGAVSGGCVEKEILRQAQTVFQTKNAVMMTYDGRYRLGCEGFIYILIEPFEPQTPFLEAFTQAITDRISMELTSYYSETVGASSHLGTEITLDGQVFSFSDNSLDTSKTRFTQTLPPCFRLYIFGTEHDAQCLAAQAAQCGWEIEIVATHQNVLKVASFPSNTPFHVLEPNRVSSLKLDVNTAVVLMTHNFAKDLNYLIQLHQHAQSMYIGVLGSTLRMEQLLSSLIEQVPEVSEGFIEQVHGPAGLDIHAITPQEIAVSILAQIISILRQKKQSMSVSKSVNASYE